MDNHEEVTSKKLRTISEMAQILSVPKSFLYSLTRRKDIPFPVIRVGKHCRFDEAETISYFKNKH